VSQPRMSYPSRTLVCSTRRLLAVALAAGLALPGGRATGQTNATFTGGTQDYGPSAFDIGRTPINSDSETFNVILPSGQVNFNGVDGFTDPSEVDRFVFQNEAILSQTGGDLTARLGISGAGKLEIVGGNFQAGPQSLFNGLRVEARDGAEVSVGALTFGGDFTAPFLGTMPVLVASGTATQVDLSSVNQIDVGLTGNFNNGLVISADDNALIDLSAATDARLTRIAGFSGEDRLRFVVQGGGDIDLFSLQTTDQVRFDVLNTTPYSLPGLQAIDRTDLAPGNGSTLEAVNLGSADRSFIVVGDSAVVRSPNLTSFTNGTLDLSGGGQILADGISNIDGTRFRLSDGASFGAVTATRWKGGVNADSGPLVNATGAGTVLDLSSLREVEIGETTQFNGRLEFNVNQGALVDLSAVESIRTLTVNNFSGTDRITFNLQSGGQLELDGLRTADAVRFEVDELFRTYELPQLESGVAVEFSAGEFTTIEAPALAELTGGRVQVQTTGSVMAGVLTNISNTRVDLSGSATFDSGDLSNIDGATFFLNDGAVFEDSTPTSIGGNFDSGEIQGSGDIYSVSGSGARLSFGNVETLDVAESGDFNDILVVRASNGGQLDLSSLQSARVRSTGNFAGNDFLEFRAETRGTIDLGELSDTDQVRLLASDGGSILAGSFASVQRGALEASDLLTTVQITGDVSLLSSSSISVDEFARLSVGGDLSYATTNEQLVSLSDAQIILNGTEGLQNLEVGGEDLGINGPSTGNFGIGRLLIGDDGVTSTVTLVDAIDNGNRGSEPGVNGLQIPTPEALYLFGDTATDGLTLLEASTLVLNDINVYAFDASADGFVHLNALFAAGQEQIAFGGGFLRLTAVPEPASALAMVAGGLTVLRRRRAV